MQQAPYISGIFKSTSGSMNVSICLPVFSDNTFTGIIRATFYTTKLCELVRHTKVGKEDYAFIVDDNGIVLSHPVERFIGQSLLEISEEEEGEEEQGEAEAISQMMAGVQGSAFLVFDEFSDNKSILAWVPIKIVNESWSLGIMRSWEHYAAPVKAYTRKLFVAVGVLMLFFVTAGIWLYRVQKEKVKLAAKAESVDKLREMNQHLSSEITERKRAQEQIENLAKFPSENPNPVLRIAKDGKVLYSNEAGKLLLSKWKSGVGKIVPEKWRNIIAESFTSENGTEEEEEVRGKVYSFAIVPVEETGYANLYARDITDRMKAEAESFDTQQRLINQQQHETEHVESELAKVRHELVQSTRLAAIGQVSGSIAHDLRNPLGAIRNAAYLLNRHLSKDKPKLLDYTEIINHEVARADQIITNLLEMVGSKVPRKRPVDLGQIIKEVEQAQMSEGVACQISADPDPFVVQADKGQLHQVIDNILSNSVYAMGGQGIIFVEASRDSDYDTIVFRDTGTGFVPEVRDRLFDALVTTKASGIGLGLTICQQIVEKHGGTIEADEHDQQGAVIRIRLPRS